MARRKAAGEKKAKITKPKTKTVRVNESGKVVKKTGNRSDGLRIGPVAQSLKDGSGVSGMKLVKYTDGTKEHLSTPVRCSRKAAQLAARSGRLILEDLGTQCKEWLSALGKQQLKLKHLQYVLKNNFQCKGLPLSLAGVGSAVNMGKEAVVIASGKGIYVAEEKGKARASPTAKPLTMISCLRCFRKGFGKQRIDKNVKFAIRNLARHYIGQHIAPGVGAIIRSLTAENAKHKVATIKERHVKAFLEMNNLPL